MKDEIPVEFLKLRKKFFEFFPFINQNLTCLLKVLNNPITDITDNKPNPNALELSEVFEVFEVLDVFEVIAELDNLGHL